MEEIFKDLLGYEGIYQVSNFGNVRKNNFKRSGNPALLSKDVNRYGYEMVDLYLGKIKKKISVHQLVAIVFLNHIPDKHKIVVDHINAIKSDNRLENLQLISPRLNLSKDKKGVSKYTGVSRKSNKWYSQINIEGKVISLGYHSTELEASKAYQDKLKEINPELISIRKSEVTQYFTTFTTS